MTLLLVYQREVNEKRSPKVKFTIKCPYEVKLGIHIEYFKVWYCFTMKATLKSLFL